MNVKLDKSKARHCHGESPVVYEATGATPGQALRRLGKHEDLRDDRWAAGSVVLYGPAAFGEDVWTALLYVS